MPTCAFPHDVESIVLRLCEDIATPRALTVSTLLKYREWDQLAALSLDPSHYNDADSLKCDYAVTSFLRKVQDLPTTIDRKAVAVENFWASEKACYKTNVRLDPYLHNTYELRHADERIGEFILGVKKFLATTLGRCPSSFEGRFGPGATFSDRGQFCTVPDKMSSSPTLTPSAMFHLIPWTSTAWARACADDGGVSTSPTFIRGNRFTTVPKDCTKDRGICVEPSVNLFYQLGVGKALRQRLKRAGIDLQRGQDIHTQVACEASKDRHLATLDLSNASDTVCSSLVKLLLPSDWHEVLFDLRSATTLVDGKTVWLEKFSSMGNGFTFELETLLFLAIAHESMIRSGVTPLVGVNLLVYGDDIIVPTECATDVISALRFFGFSLNMKKSFMSGNFRESCGGDFFKGTNVRPFFLKELPNAPQDWIAMANGIRKMGIANNDAHYLDDRFRRAWFCVLDAIPSSIRRIRGPSVLGDLVIHDSEEKWTCRVRNSIKYYKVFRPHRLRFIGWTRFRSSVVLASALYGVGDGSRGVNPRKAVISYKQGWTPLS